MTSIDPLMLTLPAVSLACGLVSALLACFLPVGYVVGILVMTAVGIGIVAAFAAPDTSFALFSLLVFGLPYCAAASTLGILAGICMRRRRFLYAGLLLVPLPLFLGVVYYGEHREANEKEQGLALITHDEQLQRFVGGPVKAVLSSTTRTRDARRYEYHLVGHPSTYAIVEVTGGWGRSRMRLACVTTLDVTKRVRRKHPCEQSRVELPIVP
jgi:hypothetical protein